MSALVGYCASKEREIPDPKVVFYCFFRGGKMPCEHLRLLLIRRGKNGRFKARTGQIPRHQHPKRVGRTEGQPLPISGVGTKQGRRAKNNRRNKTLHLNR